MTDTTDQPLTEREAATYLGFKEETLRAWRCRHALRGMGPAYVQAGSRKGVRYRKADLDTWINRNRVETSK